MRYLSVCSGIEAATVAWHPIGWEPLAFSEIEAFPRMVLAHHYPDVPCHGDFTKLRDEDWIGGADVLVGGTPCQAFSVAGLRQSLADDRGNLTLEFVRLANAIDVIRSSGGREPAIIVWENVPGVLSVKDNAFGCFLGALVGNDTPLIPTGGQWTNAGMVIGPQRVAAWRILDAQYFGVAQRRRRVFVVASARDGFDPAEVLFEREGLRRDTPPRRSSEERVADSLTVGANQYSGFNGEPVEASLGSSRRAETPIAMLTATPFTQSSFGGYGDGVGTIRAKGGEAGGGSETLIAVHDAHTVPICAAGGQANAPFGYDIAPTLHTQDEQPYVAHSYTAAFDLRGREGGAQFEGPHDTANIRAASGGSSRSYIAFHPTQTPISSEDGATHALGCGSSGGQASVAVAFAQNTRDEVREMDIVGALAANSGTKQTSYLRLDLAVRRLTPRECERLQGFPDDYTLIPVRNKDAADGPRYKALGNSMAVPVMAWIGKRIQKHLSAA